MQPASGWRTLTVLKPNPPGPPVVETTVTIQMQQGGFTAFGHSWAYNSTTDRYESSIGWIAFDGSPNTFTANWGGNNFDGTWV